MRCVIARSLAVVLVAAVLAGCQTPSVSPRPPVTPPPAAGPLLAITEVMAAPTKVANAVGEWFEVYNGGTAAVDLKGYVITSGPTGTETHTIASTVVVAPGGYVVLGNTADSAR